LEGIHILFSFVGREQRVLVKEFDRKFLYPVVVKCHEHLHLLVKSKRNFVDQNIFDEDCSLDIFEQTTSTNEQAEELVKRELFIFKRYQFDVNDIKCPLQWW
jgi:hypothetical protein